MSSLTQKKSRGKLILWKLITWQVDFVRVDLVAIDLVRIDLVKESRVGVVIKQSVHVTSWKSNKVAWEQSLSSFEHSFTPTTKLTLLVETYMGWEGWDVKECSKEDKDCSRATVFDFQEVQI